MSASEKIPTAKINNRLRWLTIIAIIEALAVLIILFSIPPDPKNALLLGFSWKRWLLILTVLLIFVLLVAAYLKPQPTRKRIQAITSQAKIPTGIEISGVLSALLLWVSVWLPPVRLGEMADDYIRLRPLLILVFLLFTQFAVFLQTSANPGLLKEQMKRLSGSRKSRMAAMIVVSLLGFVFVAFNKAHLTMGINSFYFPPGSILSALQIFSAWLLFVCLQLISRNKIFRQMSGTKWLFLSVFLVWLATFLVWIGTPFPCSNDRPGPDLPNMVCYPPIDDAVYSIGSLYTRLGEGIHNHWSTDKPLLLLVLATGQALFGPDIDRYLIFQIALIALIPALLFYIGNRFISPAGGILLASLAALKGINEIALYRSVGGMNVKIENTELLMALILIILAFSLYRWFAEPANHKWSLLSGGILGLGMLVRFNPLAIAPLILLTLLIINRKHWRNSLTGFALFGTALILTTAPWFITARDANGNNYYYLKIKDVLSTRYTQTEITAVSSPVPPMTTIPTTVETPQSPVIQTPVSAAPASASSNRMENVVLQFFNNVFSSIAELPINAAFIRRSAITAQPLWDLKIPKPLWLSELSVENLIMLLINLLMVVTGIILAYQKWGIPGLTPLVIQVGYFLGNAAAMTSGERYLLPVNWVTLIYYCIALVALSNFLFGILLPQQWPAAFRKSPLYTRCLSGQPGRTSIRQIGIMLGIFLVIGFIPYVVDFLPDRLPQESNDQVNAAAYQLISTQTPLSAAAWHNFLNSESAAVVQGKAYHPRYYQSNSLFPGQKVFELMVLAKDFVYVSEQLNTIPQTYFTEESDVILVGCILNTDEVWGSKRKIMQTMAVIQLDFEKQVIIDPQANWTCQPTP